MAYFHMSSGLRGCYMPDNVSVIHVTTRRELKALVEWEARDMKEAYGFGGSKRAVAAFVAECWQRRSDPTWTLDLVLEFGNKPGNYPFGLFLSRATRRDYLDQTITLNPWRFRAMSKQKIASVHRFGEFVALFVGTGETVYISPKEARAFARVLNACARDISKEPDFGKSGFCQTQIAFASISRFDRR